MSWRGRLVFAAALALVAGVAGGAANGWLPRLWGTGGASISAAESAPLFTEAWIRHDETAMEQFVGPYNAAKLQAWIAATPVPVAVATSQQSDREIKIISSRLDEDDGAVLDVQISSGAASGGTKTVVHERWARSGVKWLFSPEVLSAVTVERAARPTEVASRPNSTAAPTMRPPARHSDDDLDCH